MKTSRFLGLVALATLTLGSCSNDEVVNNYSQDNAIQFGTYMGRDAVSRGSIITTESLKADGNGFGVFAYYHQDDYTAGETFSPNFMNNEQVKWTPATATTAEGETEGETTTTQDGSWTYSPVKYWPNNEGDKLSFIAYAPYKEDFTFPTNGKLKYTVPTTVTEQEDLLWSKSQQYNMTKYDVGTEGKVEFVFGHALSKIDFTIAAGIDLTSVGGELAEGTTIYVDKVTIEGLNITGTLDLSAETATWSDLKDSQEYEWDYVYNNENDTELNNYTVTGSSHATALPLLKDGNDYFVIPQSTANFKIKVEYRVFTADSKLDAATDEELPEISTEEGRKGSLVKNIITVDDIELDEFVAGTQYKFNLILGMTSVKLNVTVEEWSNTVVEKDVWFNENGETPTEEDETTGGSDQGTEGGEPEAE